MKKETKVELLAPAGHIEQYLAAVENGADAIYFGGPIFNARIKADNFTMEEMEEAIDYGHLHGVKSFITLNTLIKTVELKKALKFVERLYNMGADSVIVQDLGLGNLISKAFPDMELHLSTQGSIYSEEGVREAGRLGFSRVVLARELSMEEIGEICRSTDEDIEVFVHGAYCISYSGQCQMSRSFGGRSGNRGACAQPCRLKYSTIDGSGISSDSSHIISPKDFNFLEDIGGLIEAGVNSLKIEGRMKSPEYVATVTGIYRKYIDEYYEKQQEKVLKNKIDYKGGLKTEIKDLSPIRIDVRDEDNKKLNQIFNRGGFSKGFLYSGGENNLISSEIPKHQGIEIGRVVGTKKGSTLVDILVNEELCIGDGIEIHGKNHADKPASNTLSYLKEIKGDAQGNGVNEKRKGKHAWDENFKLLRVGDIKSYVEKGDRVYKLWDKGLNRLARETFQNITFTNGKEKRKNKINIRTVIKDGKLSLEGEVLIKFADDENEFIFSAKSGPHAVEKAIDKPTSSDKIRDAVSKLGTSHFESGNIDVYSDDSYFIPVSILKECRRQLVEDIEKSIRNHFKRGISRAENSAEAILDEYFKEPITACGDDAFELYFYDLDTFYKFNFDEFHKKLESFSGKEPHLKEMRIIPLVPLAEIIQRGIADLEGEQKNFIPYITNVSKGKEYEIIKRNMDVVVSLCSERGLYVGNIEWLYFFDGYEIPLYGDFGLNTYNEASLRTFMRLGLKKIAPSLEFLDSDWGQYPLMTMEYRPCGDQISDRKNQRISLIKRSFSNQTQLIRSQFNPNLDKVLNDGDRELLKYMSKRIYVGQKK